MSVKVKDPKESCHCYIELCQDGDTIDLDVHDEDGDLIATVGRINEDGELQLFEICNSDDRSKLKERGMKFEDGYLKVKKC